MYVSTRSFAAPIKADFLIRTEHHAGFVEVGKDGDDPVLGTLHRRHAMRGVLAFKDV